MNVKRIFLRSALLIGAAALLGLTGCNFPDGQGTASASARSIQLKPRQHYEFIDKQDGLFVTYWEKHYNKGNALMTLSPQGYACFSTYSSSDPTDCNLVCGKGLAVCNGEIISWTKGKNANATWFGVYGWLQEPLVEYYIGDRKGPGKQIGTYYTDRGRYTLFVDDTPKRANILNPTNDPNLPQKFLQLNCYGPGGSPINIAQHYAAWQILMKFWPPKAGYEWYPIRKTNYCVVATEAHGNDKTTLSLVEGIKHEANIIANPAAQSAPVKGTPLLNPIKMTIVATKSWSISDWSVPDWVIPLQRQGNAGVTDVNMWVLPNNTKKQRRANLEIHLDGTDMYTVAQIFQ